MTFGEKLRNYLAAAKTAAIAGTWDKDAWVRAVDDFVEVERPLGKSGKAKAPKRKPINTMTDEEFVEFLKDQPHLSTLDVDKELGKCKSWCRATGNQMSRMRVYNWMNRAEKDLARHGRTAEVRRSDMEDRSIAPPHGWQEYMKAKQREWTKKNGDQYDAPGTDAMIRNDFFGMPKEWRADCRRDIGKEGAA